MGSAVSDHWETNSDAARIYRRALKNILTVTTFKYVGAGPGLQGCLNWIFNVAGRATLTGSGGSMKY